MTFFFEVILNSSLCYKRSIRKQTFINIWEKEENAGNLHFLFYPDVFHYLNLKKKMQHLFPPLDVVSLWTNLKFFVVWQRVKMNLGHTAKKGTVPYKSRFVTRPVLTLSQMTNFRFNPTWSTPISSTVFSSTGRRPASLCHGLLSVVRPCVRSSVRPCVNFFFKHLLL